MSDKKLGVDLHELYVRAFGSKWWKPDVSDRRRDVGVAVRNVGLADIIHGRGKMVGASSIPP